MYIEWGIVLDVAQILAIPVTVLIAFLLLRPFLKEFMARSTAVEFESLTLELDHGDADRTKGRTLPVSAELLAESSREKLEKLRLALESEQINQLIQYHANSLAQSKISFKFSIGAATFGFFVIVIGVGIVLLDPNSSASYLSVASGAIIDAVAALFFVQSNQARRSMTEFFDKLRVDRQFNESLRLCESIPDAKVQSMLKAQLALFFSGMPKDTEYVKVLEILHRGDSVHQGVQPRSEGSRLASETNVG